MTTKQLAVAARAWLDACTRLGLDPEALLGDSGLTHDEVYAPEARIDPARETTLWMLAYERSGDPDLALHAAEQLEWGAYRVIDFLAATAPTVGESLTRIARYFPIINTLVRLEAIPEGPSVLYRMTAPDLPVPLPRPAVEYTLAAITLRTRKGLALDYPLERVDFAFERPHDVSEHQRIFGCDLGFDRAFSQLVLARSVFDQPTASPDPTLSEVLESHARMLLEKVPREEGLVGRVRDAIAGQLAGGDPTLPAVARTLRVGERTLQRRLGDEGTTFADLLSDERQRLARRYLVDRALSLAEISFLLGFADQSAFTRAFTRWMGTSPGRWRADNAP